jgi:hypothetical protein
MKNKRSAIIFFKLIMSTHSKKCSRFLLKNTEICFDSTVPLYNVHMLQFKTKTFHNHRYILDYSDMYTVSVFYTGLQKS